MSYHQRSRGTESFWSTCRPTFR